MKPNLTQKLKYYDFTLLYNVSNSLEVIELNKEEVILGYYKNKIVQFPYDIPSYLIKLNFDGKTYDVESLSENCLVYLNSDLLSEKRSLSQNDKLQFLDQELVYNFNLKIDSALELRRILKLYKSGALPIGIEPLDVLKKLALHQDNRETFAIAASIDIPELDPESFDSLLSDQSDTALTSNNVIYHSVKDFFSYLPQINVLFLASNPTDTAKLQLTAEFSLIRDALRTGINKGRFSLEDKWAVTPDTLQESIRLCKPNVLHFTGHGAKGNPDIVELAKSIGRDIHDGGGIVLHDSEGLSQVVPTSALINMFKIFSQKIDLKIVILSACYSEDQAIGISTYIPYVIGMSGEIGINEATKFSCGFYSSLIQQGNDPEAAFDLAKNLVELWGSKQSNTIVLYQKGKKIA